jgi:NAD dependent epimerase/dehydratase family enzyme
MNNSNNSSTVLVAGATGFLGSEICRQLIEKNKNVKGLVRAWIFCPKVYHCSEPMFTTDSEAMFTTDS